MFTTQPFGGETSLTYFSSVTVSQSPSCPHVPDPPLRPLLTSTHSLDDFLDLFIFYLSPLQAPPSSVLSPASSYPRSANPLWMRATSVLMALNSADQWEPPHIGTTDPLATTISPAAAFARQGRAPLGVRVGFVLFLNNSEETILGFFSSWTSPEVSFDYVFLALKVKRLSQAPNRRKHL